MEKEKFEEVKEEEIPVVLETLKQDWPATIQVYYFILTQRELLKSSPYQKFVKVCCPNGDPKEGIFLVASRFQGSEEFLVNRIMIHSLPVQEKKDKLKKLLEESDVLNWGECLLFEAVLEKDIPLVIDVCAKHGKKCFDDGILNRVWLPPEQHESITFNVPEDMYLSDLTKDHVKRVNETWRYSSPGTEKMVESTIVNGKGIGLFYKADDRLVSWNTVQHFGALGMLYTEESERGKGFAKIATLALSKYFISKNIVPYACIKTTNTSSMAMFTKLGFQICDRVSWLITEKMCDAMS